MALIKCPECGKEISDQAISCPNCGSPMKKEKPEVVAFQQNSNMVNTVAPKKKKGHGCLITVLAVFIFIGIMAAAVGGAVGQNSAVQKAVSGVSDDAEYITLEEFNKIETGMSYEEVQEIVGSAGEVSVQSGSGEFSITMVTWYGNGMAGSNANVTFTNGEVTGKAQVGLK